MARAKTDEAKSLAVLLLETMKLHHLHAYISYDDDDLTEVVIDGNWNMLALSEELLASGVRLTKEGIPANGNRAKTP